ncbi:MAG: peptidoglycan -binding protein [Beijerinckiaceae bacterium]|jgi:chemotaxis protein MotB|nr:peptidoglycan -binding protein [Beijerinckiaceae bacterium]
MAYARARQRRGGFDYWPGFVDALSTMLLVVTFLLSVFMLGQYFLSREVSGKDTALEQLNKQIQQLQSLLSLEQARNSDARANLALLQSTLDDSKKKTASLQGIIDSGNSDTAAAKAGIDAARAALLSEKTLSARAQAQVDILNQQISAMRRQLAALEDALEASGKKDRESQARIADLGSRLNVALAQKVQELARYRSDFFGRLRQILGNRPGVRVVGDRFVFESSVLFPAGGAEMNDTGKQELDKLAGALVDLQKEIPPEIPWVMRVDGHTDKTQIRNSTKTNWELSAERAISVVKYLVTKGIPPQRLVAAGFGEFQPIDPGDSTEALRRNRRIELKLTER